MALNWTHFLKFLGIPVSDQDRAAQVASFCMVTPNTFEPSVHVSHHPDLYSQRIQVTVEYKNGGLYEEE